MSSNISFSKEEAICNNKYIKGVFFLYILCVILQDLPSQIPIGTIARSPYIFLSPFIFVFISFITLTFYFEKETVYYICYYAYSIIIAVLLIAWYVGVEGRGMHVYGEHLIVKLIKSGMYNFIIILTLYNFIFILRFTKLDFVEKTLQALIVIQLFIGLVQLAMPAAFNFIKSPQLAMTERLTLLNTEPSQTFPQLLISLLCYLGIRFYRHNKISVADFAISLITLALLILIQSKGGLILILICFILLVLFAKQNLKTRLKLLSLSLLFSIPTVWILVTVIIPNFIIDMDKDFGSFISLSTRGVTFLSALRSLIDYPFGQGYSTYLITFPVLLQSTLNAVSNWSSFPVSSFEIDWMIYTGRALTIKSGLLNEALYSGWAIVIFYFLFFRKSLSRLAPFQHKKGFSLIFKFTFLFIIFNYLFVTNMETSYISFLPFALLIRFSHEKDKLLRFEEA